MDFKATESALRRIAELIKSDSNHNSALRIAVDGGGCSGFMYQYQLVELVNADDYVLEQDGIKIAIDPLSQQFLAGSSVDFIEELGSSYFQINNPKATAKCGCGNSFAV